MVKDQNRSVSSHLPGLWKDKNAGTIIIVIVRRTHTWVTSFASYSNWYRHLTNDQKRREYFNLDRVNKEILLKTATGNFFAHISSSSSELLRHLWEALCLCEGRFICDLLIGLKPILGRLPHHNIFYFCSTLITICCIQCSAKTAARYFHDEWGLPATKLARWPRMDRDEENTNHSIMNTWRYNHSMHIFFESF